MAIYRILEHLYTLCLDSPFMNIFSHLFYVFMNMYTSSQLIDHAGFLESKLQTSWLFLPKYL